MCCGSWGSRESDMTDLTELNQGNDIKNDSKCSYPRWFQKLVYFSILVRFFSNFQNFFFFLLRACFYIIIVFLNFFYLWVTVNDIFFKNYFSK